MSLPTNNKHPERRAATYISFRLPKPSPQLKGALVDEVLASAWIASFNFRRHLQLTAIAFFKPPCVQDALSSCEVRLR